jgi:phage shock protein PspC (stress-responsive transcriptional regulator)
MVAKRLTRVTAAGRFGGVCAGLAAYFDLDVTLVRLLWVVLSIVPGGFIGGAIAYALAWAIIPPSPEPVLPVTGKRLHRSTTNVQIAGVCAGIAEYFDLDPTMVRLLWAVLTIWPGAIVLGVFAYLVAWAIIPKAVMAPPLDPLVSAPPL